ncbi:DUF305 domain-containing protein [Nocardioides lentus]|uniref:DUF305 domain-containing protein n=1 Tax=Nocardioides lentus TaxID=338077 RepID=A0ABP5AIK8_9ACTN
MIGLSGCSSDSSEGADAAAADPSPAAASPSGSPSAGADDDILVLRPGKPGEPAETGPTEVAENAHNDADVEFMQMMIPHHRQALVMADLAKTRAEDPAVRRLAARIRGAQAPEIAFMAEWLSTKGEDVPAPEDDTVDVGMHGEHMGMLDADALLALVEADGAEFDELFLTGMMGHHQGAVDMTDDVATTGTDQQVAELAADMNLGQSAEIGRMEDIADQL